MKLKEIILLGLFILFTLPSLAKITFWSITSVTNPSVENIEVGVKLIAESAIPWWINVMKWLTSFPTLVAAILIALLIYFLRLIGEIG